MAHGGALTALITANVFQTLRLGATVHDGVDWHAIYSTPREPWNVTAFEYLFGKELDRHVYNSESVQRAQRDRHLVLGHHAGFYDFFVPLDDGSKEPAVLITGPFATKRSTPEEILERWRWISGRQGHPSDPEFSHYARATIRTPLLEGPLARAYERLLECYTLLLFGRGDTERLSAEITALKARLTKSQDMERTWETARSMVDERSARQWTSLSLKRHLSEVGVDKPIEHAIVGFVTSPRGDVDPVSNMLKRYEFQRQCGEALQSHKNLVCGAVGDHGVMLLLGGVRTARVRNVAEQIVHSVATLARRRFGLSFHAGVSAPSVPASLPARYDQALAGAERALREGRSLVHAEPNARPGHSAVRRARRTLTLVSEKRPKALSAEFERYSEAVTMHSGYRLEAARAHLEAGFDQVAERLLSKTALDERGYEGIWQKLERGAREADTLDALSAAYRPAVADLVDMVENPAHAAQDRSLRKSVAFIHEHFGDNVKLSQVAKIAGFAPAYFCRLFKQREGMTFETYLRKLRVDHARELLTGTELAVERIAQLSGFTSRPHFHRVFRELVGETPAEYRTRVTAEQAEKREPAVTEGMTRAGSTKRRALSRKRR